MPASNVMHSVAGGPDHFHAKLIIDRLYQYEGTGRDLSLHHRYTKIKSVSELIGAFKMTKLKNDSSIGVD